jgi:hypothetical protein
MPTYLRWIVAITSGITAFFAYSILTLGIASASGHKTLNGGIAVVVWLGGWIVTLIASLAVSDWISVRYPRRRTDREPADSVADRL